tara:strand:- start:1092 stop:1241 length:150 start_codon:yes stop_codon:yes gene_type:complete
VATFIIDHHKTPALKFAEKLSSTGDKRVNDMRPKGMLTMASYDKKRDLA